MFWLFRRKVSPDVVIGKSGKRLHEAIIAKVKVGKFVRVEDLVTIAASIVGEGCIAANGEIDPRRHPFQPGTPLLSDTMNHLLSGDVSGPRFDGVPDESVFGMLREGVCGVGYDAADLPSLEAVFQHFVANVHRQEEWGRVPLSVPEEHVPFVRPLQMAYEMRPVVDRVCKRCDTVELRLHSCLFALVSILAMVKEAIDNKVALLLAVETVNGVAKTAPLTDEVIRSLQEQFARESRPQA